MSGLYLTDLPGVLNGRGLNLGWQDGWQTRARSSGGYQFGGPWVVMWHHTAGSTSQSAWDAAAYGSYSADARPVANAYVDDTGLIVIAAAGCTNTNGTGGPMALPDGRTVPLDDCNRYAFGIEICNTGVGEPYSKVQIDACFALSNAITGAYVGGHFDNVATHNLYAPSRKIDPATAGAVQGPWRPSSVTSSGTWDTGDLRAECRARGGGAPPSPGTGETALLEETVHYYLKPENEASGSTVWISDGTSKWAAHSGLQLDWDRFMQEARLTQLGASQSIARGFSNLIVCDEDLFRAMGYNVDPWMPDRDPWGWKA